MGSLYLGGPTIQEVNGKMMMGISIYGVAVIGGSFYSRFYGMFISICVNAVLEYNSVFSSLQVHGFFVKDMVC